MENQDNPIAMVHAVIAITASISLTGAAWCLAYMFQSRMRRFRGKDTRAYVSVCWGWMFMSILARLQAVNMTLFTLEPTIISRTLNSSLPPNWSELVTFIGWLLLVSLLSKTISQLV